MYPRSATSRRYDELNAADRLVLAAVSVGQAARLLKCAASTTLACLGQRLPKSLPTARLSTNCFLSRRKTSVCGICTWKRRFHRACTRSNSSFACRSRSIHSWCKSSPWGLRSLSYVPLLSHPQRGMHGLSCNVSRACTPPQGNDIRDHSVPFGFGDATSPGE